MPAQMLQKLETKHATQQKIEHLSARAVEHTVQLMFVVEKCRLMLLVVKNVL